MSNTTLLESAFSINPMVSLILIASVGNPQYNKGGIVKSILIARKLHCHKTGGDIEYCPHLLDKPKMAH